MEFYMFMHLKKIFFCVIALTMLSGCATVPMSSSDKDLQAKKFATIPDKSSIYIYRDESYGGAIKVTLSLNDKVIGQTAPYTFFRIDTAPGNQKITCHSEVTRDLRLQTKPGQLYFVRQEMKLGLLIARCKVYEVSPLVGKEAIKKCKLAQHKI